MGIYAGPAPKMTEAYKQALEDLYTHACETNYRVGAACLPIIQTCAEGIAEAVTMAYENRKPTIERPDGPVPLTAQTGALRRESLTVPATGKTTHLACCSCGDVPPQGAAFCIACGKPL